METILHYSITEKIGQATETYLAWDGQRDAKVVLRFLEPELIGNEEFRQSFSTISRRLTGLNDRHISEYFSLEEANGKLFAVREYVEGQSVRQLAHTEPFDYPSFLNIAVQVALGLREAHDVGIVHAHLTGRNIIVSPRGEAHIVEFGLEQASSVDQLPVSRPDLLPYCSPEQMEGKSPGQLSDLFSAGVIFYEMLAGELPFQGEDPQQLLAAMRDGPPSLEEKLGGELHGDAILLIEKLLACEPSRRLVSTEELVDTLRGMIAYHLSKRNEIIPHERHASPRTYLMLSILTALIVIFWLVVTTVRK